MSYLLPLAAFIFSLIFALCIIPGILNIAHKYSIFDKPNNRKSHTQPIPRIGGIAFYCCVIVSLLAIYVLYTHFADDFRQLILPDTTEFSLLLCALLILFLGGLKDDLLGIRYRFKFIIQIAAAALVICSGLYINNFHGLLGIHAISPWIGMPLTVIVLVFIINAMNFIDGIDGLSTSIGFTALSVYGVFFMLHGLWHYTVLACSMGGVLIVFFFYNVFGSVKKKRKLFMGDSGSMTLGLILGFLLIKCIYYPLLIEPEMLHPVQPVLNVVVIAISPMLLPILDVLRVILSRIKRHKLIFIADRSHIHHKLLDMGLNKSLTMIALLWVNSGFCFFNFIMIPFLQSQYIFLIDVVVWIGANMLLSYYIKKRKSHVMAVS